MFSSGKAWIVLLVLPLIALLPDITYMLCQKIFFPTPTDAVMLRQQKQPDYVFDGFSEVFCPELPNDPAHENEMMQKRHPHHLKRDNSAGSLESSAQGGKQVAGRGDYQRQPLNEEDESRYETNNNMSNNQNLGGNVY